VAAFQSDANFVSIISFSNEYVKAYTSQFNEALNITPQRCGVSRNFQSAISRFSGSATLQITKKLSGNFETQFDAFRLNVDDTLLLSTASLISLFLYYNKTNPHYGIDLSQNNRRKIS
jgi:hypothetical protein